MIDIILEVALVRVMNEKSNIAIAVSLCPVLTEKDSTTKKAMVIILIHILTESEAVANEVVEQVLFPVLASAAGFRVPLLVKRKRGYFL